MESNITLITGMTQAGRTNALRWLARQAEETRFEIMIGRFKIYHKLRKESDMPAPVLDYCALLLACEKRGWGADRKFKSSQGLTSREMEDTRRRRLAKARQGTRRKHATQEFLALHWGKVVEFRAERISFRGISRYFANEYRNTISHMTIWKYWQEWANQRKLPNG